ncbi:MAG: GNAT family N-acetyltransferase [Pirellula sp.]
MTEIDSQQVRWWEWYSQPLSFSRANQEWTWIQRIANETNSSTPVISVQVHSDQQAVAGYCVMAAGALAIHGSITRRLVSNLSKVSDIQIYTQGGDLMTLCLESLITESFQQGAELFQSLVQIQSDHSDTLCESQACCSQAEMSYLTKLVRMEMDFPFNRSIQRIRFDDRFKIEPFDSIPRETWIELLERTYQQSSDVPELAAMRSTDKAIEGYQANRTPGVNGWFVLRSEGEPAGCLILARHNYPLGEISYLGLAPEFRGKGYSSGIMQFAVDWMSAQKCSKVALAVDCRNEVAMSVYQKWGFQATISFHAWVASSKTYPPSNRASSS